MQTVNQQLGKARLGAHVFPKALKPYFLLPHVLPQGLIQLLASKDTWNQIGSPPSLPPLKEESNRMRGDGLRKEPFLLHRAVGQWHSCTGSGGSPSLGVSQSCGCGTEGCGQWGYGLGSLEVFTNPRIIESWLLKETESLLLLSGKQQN